MKTTTINDIARFISENKLDQVKTDKEKKSTFKGATENDFYFSATRSDGASVICKFKCDIEST